MHGSSVSFELGRRISSIDEVFDFAAGIAKICHCEPSEIVIAQMNDLDGRPIEVPLDTVIPAIRKYVPASKVEDAIADSKYFFYSSPSTTVLLTAAYNFIQKYSRQ